MIKNKTKNLWLYAVTALFTLCTVLACIFAGSFTKTVAKADENNNIAAKVEKVTNWSDGSNLMFYFQQDEGYTTDYMTAEWDTDDNASYNWYLRDPSFGMPEEDYAKFDSLGGQLAYEDKDKYNMPNALLDKNLDAYNMGDYILIDGVPLKNYGYTLYANRLTHVHTLSIEAAAGSALFANASELKILAGCTLPTLTYSYFGEGEASALVIEEEQNFRAKDGAWVKSYPFDGYESGELYDASEQFFYLRAQGSTYKGHLEAPIFEYTDVFSRNGWGGDEGYAIASTADTVKGSIMVIELVNPIDVQEFGLIYLNVCLNTPRKLVSHNASAITSESLGQNSEVFNIAQGFTTIKLLSALYANEDGMVETLVFEFLDDGNEDRNQNQFFVTSFYCEKLLITTPVYDESLIIQEDENNYNVTFRFNKKGELLNTEADLSKIFFNGESLATVTQNGGEVRADWSAIQNIYQLNVTLSKAYKGAAQIKNPDNNYAGNKVRVDQGLAFPNGEPLDRDYTCHVYGSEQFADYELLKDYQEANVVDVTGFIDTNSADNIHFLITFDVQITSQIYYHACEREGWRSSELPKYNLYDGTFSPVYIAGGFKSSLLDNLLINGKTLGEYHADDAYTTCVFVQVGQTNLYSLDLSIDSNSATYDALYPLFTSGNGIELEIREGLKFTTGYKVNESTKYVLSNGNFQSQANLGEMEVFFDGKRVAEGGVIEVETVATKESVSVSGVDSFTVVISEVDGLKKFTVESSDGQIVTFSVRENLTALPTKKTDEGCGSTLSIGFAGVGAALLLGAVAVVKGKKKDEE